MKYQNSFWNNGLLRGFPHSLYFKHHFRLLHQGKKPHQSKKQGQRKEEAQWNHKPPQQPWNAFFSKLALSKARFTNTPWSCCVENLVHHVNALYQCGSIYADCTCFFWTKEGLAHNEYQSEIEYDPKWLISTHILIHQYIYWSLTAFFHGKVTPTKFPRHMVRFLDLSAKSRHGT